MSRNLVDRAVAYVSPERGLKRDIARAQSTVVSAASSLTSGNRSETPHRGASRVLRSLASWVPGLKTPWNDLPRTDRRTMVARSYDAYRNHMIARAAITRPRTNIVGTGLIPHAAVDADVLRISEDEADELNLIINSEWATWADNPAECDVEATLDFAGNTSLALLSSMLSGDCFALTPYVQRPMGLWELKVQLVDASRVSNPMEAPDTPNLIDGVEMDNLGFPYRYWIRRRHPSDTLDPMGAMHWDPVDVFGRREGRRRVMHVWNDKDRIGMVRGAPFLGPILEPLQQLESYGRAELMAAVVSSLFTVFLKKERESTSELGAPMSAFTGEEEGDDDDQPSSLEMGPANILDLEPGTEPVFANPARPSAKFDPFFMAVVRQMGAALEMPGEELLLIYNESYSAARAAMLQAYRFYTMRRWWLVQQFCAPIRLLWFDEAVARGRIPVKGYADPKRRAAYAHALWVGPARGAMDELKEAQAAEKRIQIGVSNETIETAAMTGEDWRDVQRTRARELKRRKAEGMDGAEPAPADEGVSEQEELRDRIETYGTAVRAGVVTPQVEDEEAVRAAAGLPPMSEPVREAWERDQGTRRPVTLSAPPGSQPAAPSASEPEEDEES